MGHDRKFKQDVPMRGLTLNVSALYEMKIGIFGKKKKYSYIKKPFAKNGWVSLAISLMSFGLTQGLLFFSILRRGNVSLLYALLGVWAILFDMAAFLFAVAGIAEKEKNYTVVIICFIVEIMVLVEWAIVLS